MRILLVTLGYPKFAGDSTAPFIARIAESVASRGHAVDVVLPAHPEFRHPGHEGVAFFPYRYSPVSRISPWGFGGALKGSSQVRPLVLPLLPAIVISLRRRIEKLLATGSYDVVHGHWLLPNAWAASGPASKYRVPLVVTLHGSDVAMAERVAALGRLARATFARSAAVTAVSEDLRERARKLGADSSKTSVVRLGVDTQAFAPRPGDGEARRRLGASADESLVVAVGRLIEVKGFRYLIEAVRRLEGIHLAVIGDGPLRGELEELARSIRDRVTFTGNLDRFAVSEAVAAADIVAVPSIISSKGFRDGLPTTLLEAMAAGRPIVASAIGGIPEVLAHETNGLLVPEKNPRALADAVRRLRSDPGLSERLGANARATAISTFDWASAAEAFERIFEAAVDSGRGGTAGRRGGAS
jgi:glycosyltransferase involved in cell wall biosynthesis